MRKLHNLPLKVEGLPPVKSDEDKEDKDLAEDVYMFFPHNIPMRRVITVIHQKLGNISFVYF